MTKRLIAILLTLVLALSLAAAARLRLSLKILRRQTISRRDRPTAQARRKPWRSPSGIHTAKVRKKYSMIPY